MGFFRCATSRDALVPPLLVMRTPFMGFFRCAQN